MRPDRSCFIPLFGELRIANVAAQTRIVSVARIRLDSWKSVRSFKGIFYNDISEFESDHLSQPVRSPSADTRTPLKTAQHRGISPILLSLRVRNLGHWSVFPPLVSGGYFWCLVFDLALKALGWFSRETRRYLCGSLSLAPDRLARRWGEPGSSMARM